VHGRAWVGAFAAIAFFLTANIAFADEDGGVPDDAGVVDAALVAPLIVSSPPPIVRDSQQSLSLPASGSCTLPAAQPPLDVREAPFADLDSSWLNGTNRQPASLLGAGPVTFSIYADAYYAYQFQNPIDHTIFPTTTAPRSNEISLNLAALGVDVTGLDGPIGRVYLQYGANTQTDTAQDKTLQKGYFLTSAAFTPIQQAAAGWHFHALHGINFEVGIFPSYVGMESYLPQENWNYTHPFISDFTPYYFAGSRTQIFPSQHVKIELWLVNGWQTLGQWHEARSGGYVVQWRPGDHFLFGHDSYIGQDDPTDDSSVRVYTDNYAQIQYFKKDHGLLRSLAIAAVADLGYETHRGLPDGVMNGYSLTHRAEFGKMWALTFRGDIYYDKTQSVILQLPIDSPYSLPDKGAFLGGGFTSTLDFLPSPWIIWRLEYAHRAANIPYFSGSGGITGPNGLPSATPNLFQPDLRKSDDRILFNVTLRL
jgi:hypothetical protein